MSDIASGLTLYEAKGFVVYHHKELCCYSLSAGGTVYKAFWNHLTPVDDAKDVEPDFTVAEMSANDWVVCHLSDVKGRKTVNK